ncbi:MAG: cytochrome c biogenesis protein CcdA [Anaerolineae bacterium]
MDVGLWLAFVAGLVSFLSPCVLPLVPAYIGYMGGRVTHTVSLQVSAGGSAAVEAWGARMRVNTFLHGVAFVFGFTLVFVVFGLLTTAFLTQVGGQNIALVRDIIGRTGGLLIIFFGLHFMGAVRWALGRVQQAGWTNSPVFSIAFLVGFSVLALWALVDPLIGAPVIVVVALWMVLSGAFSRPTAFWGSTIGGLNRMLYADTRRQMQGGKGNGFAGSVVMGVIFAAGWTPCIGPIYGSILTLAATGGGSVAQAGGLMIAYSLGLGVPFLMTALLLDSAQGLLRRIQRHLHTIELISGGFLVFIGILVASGQLQSLSQNFATQFSDFSYRLEDCVVGVTRGELTLGEFGTCMNGDEAGTPGAAAPAADGAAAATVAEVEATPTVDAVEGTAIGNLAPDFALPGDDGQTYRLSDFRGRPVLLNFWATWCGPCRVEMPAFQQVHETGSDLAILAVDYGQTAEDVAGYREEMGVTFPLLVDETMEVGDTYGVAQIPSTFLIGPDGRVVTVHYGPLTVEQINELAASAT